MNFLQLVFNPIERVIGLRVHEQLGKRSPADFLSETNGKISVETTTFKSKCFNRHLSVNNVCARRYYHLKRDIFSSVLQFPFATTDLVDGKTLLSGAKATVVLSSMEIVKFYIATQKLYFRKG